jgi:hypothetical protein
MILCIQCARSLVEGSSAFGQGLSSFFCGEQKRFNFKPAAIETMKELMAVGPFNHSFMLTQEHIQGIMLVGDFTCCSRYATIRSSVSYRPCFLSPDCITRPAVFIVGFDSGNSGTRSEFKQVQNCRKGWSQHCLY